jgi:hypothetical protein
MSKISFLVLLAATHSALFAQTQEQPKQTSSFQRTTVGFGIDLINANNIRLNNPAFYVDWLYRSKSKSFMGGIELESSFFTTVRINNAPQIHQITHTKVPRVLWLGIGLLRKKKLAFLVIKFIWVGVHQYLPVKTHLIIPNGWQAYAAIMDSNTLGLATANIILLEQKIKTWCF